MVTYSDSGVDIDLEEVTVAKLAEKLKPTLKYRDIITESGHFAALVRMGDRAIAMSTDGIGSKILVAKMMENYDTVGIDCIAMVVNDILCVGAEPVALVDYLAVEEPNPDVAGKIAEGLAEGAKLSKIAIIGGETASLPEVVNDFDLAGTGIGFVDVDKIITGKDISEGDILIGIKSSGIHSNGLSLARKTLLENDNFDINDPIPNNPETTIGEELLRPTELYVKPIVDLFNKNFNINGLAHITGGGFTNLKRLKKGIGFDIENLPEPQKIFKLIYSQNVSLEEMYKVFNMGIGFVVIVPEEESEKVINALNKNCESYKIGKVSSNADKVRIKTFKNTEIEY
ncbi:Phosphoribosylformylglycinamidine cyclo-ligase [Candidatus Methanobinarius endosymbioticus]|uniref:Phosphoribosylformylglycinamidine cyclo-ligase n=1 Tax=Candidatus Methanobinarius endosymbioticus TaxID=2006182 RepID=A0A366M965_9EURY|nr:Phosphoribosylformylglycinamidine cyclo-ligase [Candidatus Methanobinarius endosymbioticus]